MLILSLVAEPMDSVYEDAGPQEPKVVCHSEIKFNTSMGIQKEVAVCLAITEVQKQVVDAPASSEILKKDPESAQDGRTAATPPKPGKKFNKTTVARWDFPISNMTTSAAPFLEVRWCQMTSKYTQVFVLELHLIHIQAIQFNLFISHKKESRRQMVQEIEELGESEINTNVYLQ